jgi:hypothetical protein
VPQSFDNTNDSNNGDIDVTHTHKPCRRLAIQLYELDPSCNVRLDCIKELTFKDKDYSN